MGDEPFDYIGLPFNDTASVNTMATEMNDSSGRWSYVRQLYGHVYTAKTGTLSELVAAGDQFNLQHITLAGYEKDTQTPADELAASRTARAAVFIRNDPARPTQTGELVDMLPAPKANVSRRLNSRRYFPTVWQRRMWKAACCVFSGISRRTGKMRMVWRITATLTARRCIPVLMCCAV